MNVHLRVVSTVALEDSQATGSFVSDYKYNISLLFQGVVGISQLSSEDAPILVV